MKPCDWCGHEYAGRKGKTHAHVPQPTLSFYSSVRTRKFSTKLWICPLQAEYGCIRSSVNIDLGSLQIYISIKPSSSIWNRNPFISNMVKLFRMTLSLREVNSKDLGLQKQTTNNPNNKQTTNNNKQNNKKKTMNSKQPNNKQTTTSRTTNNPTTNKQQWTTNNKHKNKERTNNQK